MNLGIPTMPGRRRNDPGRITEITNIRETQGPDIGERMNKIEKIMIAIVVLSLIIGYVVAMWGIHQNTITIQEILRLLK